MINYDASEWKNLCTKYREILDTLNNTRVVTAQKLIAADAADKAWEEFDEAVKTFEDVKNKMEAFRKELLSQ
jgi:ppGpp synthetase/RelA/SpoT-type nucleotidyltranferase